MSFFKQIKSILNKSDTQPTGEDTTPYVPTERRRQKRYIHTGRKILVIDDSATIVASLRKTLQSAGCLIDEASDAETGIGMAREGKPDLIYLDIVLPGMNGFAALRQMRRDATTHDIPVIMISGNEQATEQFYAKRIGADDFMKKPFSRHEVFARIEALVASGKLRRLDARMGADTIKQGVDDNLDATLSAPKTATLPNEAVANMTSLDARRQLASMGLKYFSQDQFSAAIKRGDKLAIDLFIIGGGVKIEG